MSYPTLEKYQEALQHPELALLDGELRGGRIATTGLGTPLALCGGFALTYMVTVGGRQYAVRCFHKKSDKLQQRYQAIGARLKQLASPYFVGFEFQNQGVRVDGQLYPVVKMQWAKGATLGEFLEKRHTAGPELRQLRASLKSLNAYLERNRVAHGDVQPGNVMVGAGGQSVQLIDYDGMYVEQLKSLGSAELGHRNFQHPLRNESTWSPTLDRFSFVALNVALTALESHPELWARTQSDGDAVLFRAHDFAHPESSAIFQTLMGLSTLGKDAKNLAAISKSPFDRTPTLEDFLAGRNIPQLAVTLRPSPPSITAPYAPIYPVLSAHDYSACLQKVGDRVEVIGCIVEVKAGTTRYGAPYIFVNFGPWRGEVFKISIWSEGIGELSLVPDATWVGKWVRVVGLMETPYVSRKFGYTHLSISVTQSNQMHLIDEKEARFRLGLREDQSFPALPVKKTTGRGPRRTARPAPHIQAVPTRTRNQEVLNAMRSQKGPGRGPVTRSPSGSPAPTTATGEKGNYGCWIWALVIGLIYLFLILL